MIPFKMHAPNNNKALTMGFNFKSDAFIQQSGRRNADKTVQLIILNFPSIRLSIVVYSGTEGPSSNTNSPITFPLRS